MLSNEMKYMGGQILYVVDDCYKRIKDGKKMEITPVLVILARQDYISHWNVKQSKMGVLRIFDIVT